jgi:hypothetical protein
MGCKLSRDKSMDNVPYTIGMHGVRVPTRIKFDMFDEYEHGYVPDWHAMNRVETLELIKRRMTKEEYRKRYCEYRGGHWWLVRK